MGIKEELGSVLTLQRQYSADLNEAMRARGQLIRHSLPASLASIPRICGPVSGWNRAIS